LLPWIVFTIAVAIASVVAGLIAAVSGFGIGSLLTSKLANAALWR